MTQIIEENRYLLMVYGLALVPLLAGISKFLDPGLWLKPVFISSIPLSQTAVTYLIGGAEVFLGLALFTRKRPDIFSFVVFLWLLGITVQVTYFQLWTIAIRDLGLTLFALTAAIFEFSRRKNREGNKTQ